MTMFSTSTYERPSNYLRAMSAVASVPITFLHLSGMHAVDTVLNTPVPFGDFRYHPGYNIGDEPVVSPTQMLPMIE